MKRNTAYAMAAIAIAAIAGANSVKAEPAYFFVDAKTGVFLNGCKDTLCPEQPDGNFPAYFSFGVHQDVSDKWSIEYTYQHRSNLDLGFPRTGSADDTKEYYRDGLFINIRYKINPIDWMNMK